MPAKSEPPRRIVVGCMTGTSIDAIDAACVAIEGVGLGLRAEIMSNATAPLGSLTERLRALATQQPMSAGWIAALARDFSIAHIDAIRNAARGVHPDLIVVHGQTVYHDPPLSWQLIAPTVIAHALKTNVVCDLRAADLVAGGQGAPITPIADWVLFRDAREARVVLNLGGFCNFTHLPPGQALDAVAGGDICICNQLLDRIARVVLQSPYDEGGQAAASGSIDNALLDEISALLARQSQAGRSLGSRDETIDCITEWARQSKPQNLARTACEAIAKTIADWLPRVDRILLAGGGAKNASLVAAIQNHCDAQCRHTDQFGVPADAREAVEMAVLGALCQDRVPIALPQVTGAPIPTIAGIWAYNPHKA